MLVYIREGPWQHAAKAPQKLGVGRDSGMVDPMHLVTADGSDSAGDRLRHGQLSTASTTATAVPNFALVQLFGVEISTLAPKPDKGSHLVLRNPGVTVDGQIPILADLGEREIVRAVVRARKNFDLQAVVFVPLGPLGAVDLVGHSTPGLLGDQGEGCATGASKVLDLGGVRDLVFGAHVTQTIEGVVFFRLEENPPKPCLKSEMRGVTVHVYRSDLGDCTGGGVTSPNRSKGKIFVVFDPSLSEGNLKLEDCMKDDRFVCMHVVRRSLGGSEYLHVEPINQPQGMVGPMFGGNYAKGQMRGLCQYPLPIHDRFETEEDYSRNFR